MWGLPEKIIKNVEYHHIPEKLFQDEFNPVMAIYIADYLVNHKIEIITICELNIGEEYIKKFKLDEYFESWISLSQLENPSE